MMMSQLQRGRPALPSRRGTDRHRWTAAALASLVVAAASCGGVDDGAPPPPQAASSDTTVATTAAPAADPSTTPAGTALGITETTLPGDPFDPIYTPAGAELGAVAVPFDETLDLHELPGADQPVLASLSPLATGIVSTGRARALGVRDVWLEVTADGTTGWTPLLHLAYVGGTSDATAAVLANFDEPPTAPTVLALGRLVAESVASTDSEVTSRIVVVVGPVEAANGSVTYDVVDFPDDSIAGQRLEITTTAGEGLPESAFRSGTGHVLASVTSTLFCLRGVADGICV